MKVEPLYDRILVRLLVEGEPSRSGLVVPDIARGKRPYAYGEVLSVGQGRVNMQGVIVPLQVKPGDVVCFGRKAGIIIPVLGESLDDEEELTMLREPEVLAIVHDLPRQSSIAGPDGRLLSMAPRSHAAKGIETWEESKEVDAKLKEEGWIDGIEDPELDGARPQPGED